MCSLWTEDRLVQVVHWQAGKAWQDPGTDTLQETHAGTFWQLLQLPSQANIPLSLDSRHSINQLFIPVETG